MFLFYISEIVACKYKAFFLPQQENPLKRCCIIVLIDNRWRLQCEVLLAFHEKCHGHGCRS